MSKAGRWYVVGLLAALYVFSLIDRFVISLLIEPLKADLKITDTQVGLLIGPAFVFFYASLGLPIAWLVDRGNRVWIAWAGIVIWSASTLASGYADGFPALLVLRMGVALGEAALIPTGISIIADIFERHERATPTAIFISAGGIGSAATYALGSSAILMIQSGVLQGLPIIGALPDWRATFVLVGLPSLILGFLLLFTVRDPTRRSAAETPTTTSSRGVFRTAREGVPFYTLYFLGTGFLTMSVMAVFAWYPTYLVRTFGISISTAGYLMTPAVALPPLLGIMIPIIAERRDRSGRRDSLIPIQLSVMALGFIILIISMNQTTDLRTAVILTTVGYSLVAATNGLYSVIVGLTAPTAYRGRIIAIGIAVVSGLGFGGGPFLVGAMAEHFMSRTLGGALLTLVLATGPLACICISLAWRRFRAFQV